MALRLILGLWQQASKVWPAVSEPTGSRARVVARNEGCEAIQRDGKGILHIREQHAKALK